MPETALFKYAAAPDRGTDRRASRRQVVSKPALIVTAEWTMDCMVRDISDTGARLLVRCTAEIPRFFKIRSAATNTMAKVERIWRSADEVGVRVLGGWNK